MFTEADSWQGSSSTSGRRTSNGGNTGEGGFEAMFHVRFQAQTHFSSLLGMCSELQLNAMLGVDTTFVLSCHSRACISWMGLILLTRAGTVGCHASGPAESCW